MNQLIGQRIGNYQLEALLGEGGMGAVYRARDVHLNRVVALKVMNQRLARDPEFQRRFLQEAQAAARLKHPSIVQIYHFDNRQGLLYMAMAYVPGLTLGATMRRLAASKQVILLSESLALIAQVADALGYAHRQGVFHRDIKPDNVLLEPLDVPDREGDPPLRAVVTDFGLAKLREGGVETQTGMFLGTMPYMSPEQCRGRNIDGRSDIYSLGILLFQLVSGRLPFEVKTPADAAEKHIREMPPLPRTFRPDLPQEIEAIILKTLAKRPEERQQTGEELARDLRQAAAALSGEVLTQLAPATSITSLVTEIMSEPGQIPAPTLGSDLSLFADSDTLIIQQEGQEDQKQPLAKATIVIGRAQGNDIVLEAAGISRQHLRLERTTTGWQLIDLGSSNGTWVKGSKLLPNIPEPWELGQVVRIGSFMLRWQPATTTSPGTYPAPRSSAIMPPTSSGATQILTMDGQLGIVVDPTHVEINAGETARVQLDLFNQGITVDHFHPEVEGLPAEWVTISQVPVQLMPDGTVSLPFAIHPPRHSSASAGRHRYRLHLFSQARRQAVGTIEGSVTIRPFIQFAIDAQPTQLQHGGICRVNVRNEGNASGSYRVLGRDSAEALQFEGQQTSLTIEPGQTAVVPLKIQAKTRPLMGRARPYPFRVDVATTGQEAQTRSGSLEVKPRIPGWVLTLIPILLALLCGGGLFGYQWYEGNLQTATAVALQAVVSQETAVAQTTQVALATQAANDDDGDGLSNTAEGAGGTDPQNPDTDGDGLLDGGTSLGRESTGTRQ
jgi:serine/threonine protein kinase